MSLSASDRARRMIESAMSGTTEKPSLVVLSECDRHFLANARGKRGQASVQVWARGAPLEATFRPIDEDPHFPSVDTAAKLDAMFDSLIVGQSWFEPTEAKGAFRPHVELSGRFEVTSPTLGFAVRHFRESSEEGTGGGQVGRWFTEQRTADRMAFHNRIRAVPLLSLVDFTSVVYAPSLSLSGVNLGSFSADDLWLAYRFFLSEMPLRVHWKHYQLLKRDVATCGFKVIERENFFRLVKVARDMQCRPRCPSRQSRASMSALAAGKPDEPVGPPVPYLCLSAADYMYWLGEPANTVHISSGPSARPDSFPVECDPSQPVYPLTSPLRSVAGSFSELECMVAETAVSLVGHRPVPVDIITTDADGVIVGRTSVETCGFLGTGFPTLGAVAARELADRYAANRAGVKRSVFSASQKAAVKRRRLRALYGDADPVSTKAANARAIQNENELPLGTPDEPGCFSGINLLHTLGTKKRTKRFRDPDSAPPWDLVANIIGPCNDPGGNSGQRLKEVLPKRNTDRTLVKFTKEQLVAALSKNLDYLALSSTVRRHGRKVVGRITEEHVAILRKYTKNKKMIRDTRWAAVRAIKEVGKLKDVNADRDQSNCGPQSLRQAAARLDLSRSLLAEAAALAPARPGKSGIEVVGRNDDRRYGYTPVRVLRPFEFYEILERPVRVAVPGHGVWDTAAHPESSVERRAVGYVAHLLEAAVRASRQSEILRAMEAAPGAAATGDGAGDETEQIRDEISIAVNLLRTVLPRPLLSSLRAKLRF